MRLTAKFIAQHLNGELVGDSEVFVTELARIEDGREGSVCFLANPKYTQFIYTSKASVFIINKSFISEKEIKATLIKVDDAYSAFASLLKLQETLNTKKKKGIHRKAFIGCRTKIGKGAYIAPFTYVGEKTVIGENATIMPQVFIGDNVKIGKNVNLYPGVKIYEGIELGDNVTVHAGTVIGSDGFGFAPNTDNSYDKIPQLGNVLIEDNVEIGANCAIDRATMGSTIIRKGVKLDNLVHIAHNVEIGSNTVIAAQTGIAGSAKLGKNIMIGGQVGVSGHLSIADGVKIAGQSGVGANIHEENKIMQGSPAFEIKEYQRSYVLFRRFSDMFKKMNELEKLVKKIASNSNE